MVIFNMNPSKPTEGWNQIMSLPMRLTLEGWHADLIDYRCSLSRTEVRRLRGSLAGWDCRDLKLFVGEVSEAGPQSGKLDSAVIPTVVPAVIDGQPSSKRSAQSSLLRGMGAQVIRSALGPALAPGKFPARIK